MIYILYEFTCAPNNVDEFIRCWTDATKLIHSNYGSLGSRLHRADDNTFIGYAAWPDQETFEQSLRLPNAEVEAALAKTRDVLIESKRLHIMRPVEDMLLV